MAGTGAGEIGTIVNSLEGIAFQRNLLALNAAVTAGDSRNPQLRGQADNDSTQAETLNDLVDRLTAMVSGRNSNSENLENL